MMLPYCSLYRTKVFFEKEDGVGLSVALDYTLITFVINILRGIMGNPTLIILTNL